jgi:hypothetical protein
MGDQPHAKSPGHPLAPDRNARATRYGTPTEPRNFGTRVKSISFDLPKMYARNKTFLAYYFPLDKRKTYWERRPGIAASNRPACRTWLPHDA